MNEVTNFMYYMYNKWDECEAKVVFGDMLGEHIFNKWVQHQRNEMRWYAELDTLCRNKVVQRANELYGKFFESVK